MPWSDIPEKPATRDVLGWGSVIKPATQASAEGWAGRGLSTWVKYFDFAGAGDLVMSRFERYAANAQFSAFGYLEIEGALPPVAPVTTTHTTVGAVTYSIPYWADTLDVVVLGAGGGGNNGTTLVTGQGGTAGQWAQKILTRGVDFPLTATSLTVTVGAGGAANGGTGGASQVTGTGVVTMTANGGVGGGNSGQVQGKGSGNFTCNGIVYTGSSDTTGSTNNIPGNAPGGGGRGGNALGGAGGVGARGQVWIRAWQNTAGTILFDKAGAWSWTVPAGFTNIDVVCLGGGAGGGGGVAANMAGDGGYGGNWLGKTLTVGVDVAAGGTLTGVVGAGGAGGPDNAAAPPGNAASAGQNSTCTQGSVVGTGGAIRTAQPRYGFSPGDFTFNGIVYKGGLQQNTNSANGLSPGGGGNGGNGGLFLGARGGAGAAGAVWIRPWSSSLLKKP